MAQPKKRTSKTKTGMRRSHLMSKLRRAVNRTSPVKAQPTKKARPAAAKAKPAKARAAAKPATKKAKPATKKPTAKPKAKGGGKAASVKKA